MCIDHAHVCSFFEHVYCRKDMFENDGDQDWQGDGPRSQGVSQWFFVSGFLTPSNSFDISSIKQKAVRFKPTEPQIRCNTMSQPKKETTDAQLISGWWFETWILFFHLLGRIIPTDDLIFFRNHQADFVLICSRQKKCSRRKHRDNTSYWDVRMGGVEEDDNTKKKRDISTGWAPRFPTCRGITEEMI